MITTIDKWYRYEELLKMVTLVAFRRKGVDNSEFDKAVEFLREKGGNVICLPLSPEQISSSEIRKMPPDQMEQNVPAFIWDYIEQNKLFMGETNAK